MRKELDYIGYPEELYFDDEKNLDAYGVWLLIGPVFATIFQSVYGLPLFIKDSREGPNSSNAAIANAHAIIVLAISIYLFNEKLKEWMSNNYVFTSKQPTMMPGSTLFAPFWLGPRRSTSKTS